MSKLFSSDILFKIRNDIQIKPLIADILSQPYRYSENIFSFLMPYM